MTSTINHRGQHTDYVDSSVIRGLKTEADFIPIMKSLNGIELIKTSNPYCSYDFNINGIPNIYIEYKCMNPFKYNLREYEYYFIPETKIIDYKNIYNDYHNKALNGRICKSPIFFYIIRLKQKQQKIDEDGMKHILVKYKYIYAELNPYKIIAECQRKDKIEGILDNTTHYLIPKQWFKGLKYFIDNI